MELIVRGNDWGVQLDVKEFPLFCPSCRNYLNEIYEHTGSRYGQVGSVKCDCGEELALTDIDNIVEWWIQVINATIPLLLIALVKTSFGVR